VVALGTTHFQLLLTPLIWFGCSLNLTEANHVISCVPILLSLLGLGSNFDLSASTSHGTARPSYKRSTAFIVSVSTLTLPLNGLW